MNNFARLICVGGLVGVLSLSGGCSAILGQKVDPGHVALIVDNYGDQTSRGIQGAKLLTGGKVQYNSVTSDLYEFPVYLSTYNFQSTQEGGNNSIRFSMGGTPVEMDMGATYRFRAEPVDSAKPEWTYIHQVFGKYRVAPDVFNRTTFANALRDAANEVASGKNPVELAGDTPKFLAQLQSVLVAKFPELEITQISLLSPPRLPEKIQDAINASFTAQQAAETAKYTKLKAEAEAAANAAKAKGEADANVIRAEGQAKANQLEAASITPVLVDMRRVELESERIGKWDGKFAPTVQTQSVQLGAGQ